MLALLQAYRENKLDSFKQTCNPKSFYVYQKRLKDKLLNFIANNTFHEESTEEILPLKLLIAARKLLLLGYKSDGLKTLSKAEKSAKYINHFGLLNEIYQTEIQYSEHRNQEEIISLHTKLMDNNNHFLNQEKLNLAYVMIKNSFKNQHTIDGTYQINTAFKEAINLFNLKERIVLNFKQLYQLVEVINLKAIQDKNFEETNLFFLNQLKLITNTPLDNPDSAIYHIKTLLAIANIRFRKKEFKQSINILNDLKVIFEKYEHLECSFHSDYVLLKSLNLNFINRHNEASYLLDKHIGSNISDQKSNFNLTLVRIMIYFQQGEKKAGLSLLATLKESDRWIKNNIGFEWLLNKKYIEILIHIELDNQELVESRINSLLKAHKAYFVKNENFQIIPFLKLVKQYYKNPSIIKSTGFQNSIDKTIISKPNNKDDLFLMCFYAWLMAKINNSDLYQTTLSLIHSNSKLE
jgi:hypothetical protein